MENKKLKICAILTCFNRKESTLTCMRLLKQSCDLANVNLNAIVVDDGSTDGTSQALLQEFDWLDVEYGDGSLFWNRGMYKGLKSAENQSADFILWINDDTHLLSDAIERLLTTHQEILKSTQTQAIIVGATADRETGKLTYSGQVALSKTRPFTFRKVWSETEAVECETMNGNLVLIPKVIFDKVGNVDPVFEHAMGDIDYALRTRRAGFKVYVAPGFVGHCSNNPSVGTYQDTSLPFSTRWKKMLSKKGLPVRSWRQLTSKHGGMFWPIYFLWPYCRIIFSGLRHTLAKRG